MLALVGKKLEAHCDIKGCYNKTIIDSASSAAEAMEMFKTSGWVLQAACGNTYHYCPQCVKKAEAHLDSQKAQLPDLLSSVPHVHVKVALIHPNAKLPIKKTDGAAAYDFCACEARTIQPGERMIVPTGLKIEMPIGWQLRLSLRSGLSSSSPLIQPNAPGIVDSDYRGEIGLILFNAGKDPYVINVGDRVQQGVFVQAPVADFEVVKEDQLSVTGRGTGGHGSTGKQ